MRIAIVTGASSGLGADFARQLDASAEREKLDEIWLIARRSDQLQSLAGELRNTTGRVMPMDLTDPERLAGLHATLKQLRPKVCWLINNAGFGKIGPFEHISQSATLGMIDLNIRSLTEITRFTLPFCPEGAHIVQVASSAGFMPIPYFATYAATKAYVVQFSDALGQELRHRNISVTAVCPGPVATEFLDVASDGRGSPPRALLARSPDVVRKALRDARRRRRHSVHGLLIRLFTLTAGWIPRWLSLAITGHIRMDRMIDREP
ncbi:MAG: SDR family NAD(P)-dependent oxidoreductase [Deltaproteobacteria bacterium]|nr:MAG: SDR family NAD(P)-dependent oxidoreductase [Deltaproteobacteria bacterium]